MNSCPVDRTLIKMLLGQLDDGSDQSLADHIENCATCQARCEALTAVDQSPVQDFSDQTDDAVPEFLQNVLKNPPLTPDTADSPPGRIDNYVLTDELGRGSFGVVYRAWDEKLHRHVAIKLLKTELAKEERFRRRFIREGQAASAIDHDHVIRMYLVGETDDGIPYLVMELFSGDSLRDLIRRENSDSSEPHSSRGFDPAYAARLICNVAQGLQAVHDAGLVHRDIKPSNIILDAESGVVKIADFGLVRSEDESGVVSRMTGRIVGAPAYMSPEQIISPDDVDGKSDVYSLGVVLYELLTGERPFRGSGQGLLLQVVHEEPISVAKLNPNLPLDLVTIVGKCLAKKPGERYLTATELAEDLTRHLNGVPIVARPVGLPIRFWKWCRRNPLLASISLCLVLSLLAGTAVSVNFGLEASAARDDALKFAAESGQNEADARKHEARANLRRDAASGRAVRQAMTTGQIFAEQTDFHSAAMTYSRALQMATAAQAQVKPDSTDEIVGPDRAAESRDSAASAEETQWQQERIGLQKSALEFSPARQSMIRRAIGAVNGNAPMLKTTCFGDGPIQYAEFSPNGRFVVIVSSAKGAARIWDAEKGVPVSPVLMFDRPSPVFRARFSPDGKQLLVVGRDMMSGSRLVLFTVPEGKRVLKEKAIDGAVWSAEFSPDGNHILTAAGVQGLFGGQSGEAVVRRVSDLKPDGARIEHDNWLMDATFSPDGSRIATASVDNVVRVWNSDSGAPVTNPMMMKTPQHVVTFNSEGTRIVSAGNSGKARVWNAETGAPVTPVLSHGDINGAPTGPGGVAAAAACFSLNDRAVATVCGDKTVRLWSAETGEPLTAPLRHEDHILSCEFQPSSNGYLLTGSLDGTARLWDPATGLPVGSTMRHLDRIYCARFAPVDNRLVTVSEDSTARIWEFKPGRPAVPRSRPAGEYFDGNSVFSDDGQFVIEAETDGATRILKAVDLKPIGKPLAVPHAIRSVAFSTADESNRVLLSSLLDAEGGRATLWNGITGEQIGEEIRPPGAIAHAAISADGRWCAFAGSATGPFVNVWDVTDSKWILEAKDSVTGYQHLAFSSDAAPRLVASGLDGNAYVWSMQRPNDPLIRLNHSGLPVNTAQFSRDGAFIVTASTNDMAAVWHAATGRKLSELKHSDTVTGAAFSPAEDSLAILSWSEDRTARLWQHSKTETKNRWIETDIILRHRGEVTDAAFSADATMIATALADGSVRVWDAYSGNAISPAFRHIYTGVGMTPSVRKVRFSPDGSRLLSQTSLHTWIRELPIAKGSPDQLVKQAEWTAGWRFSENSDVVRIASPRRVVSNPDSQYYAEDGAIPIASENLDEYLSLLIEADTNAYPARQWRARRAREDGDIDRADSEFEAAVRTEFGKQDGQLWYEYGSLLREDKQYEAAWDAVSRAIELGHLGRGEVHGTRSSIAVSLNRFSQAVDDANAAMSRATMPAVYQIPRAVAHASLKNWDAAATDFDTAFRVIGAFLPVQPGFRYQRAVLELAKGRPDDFRKSAVEIVKEMRGRTEEDAAFFGAWICAPVPNAVDEQTMQTALQMARSSVEEKPDETDRICALGAILLRAGQAKEAADILRQAMELHDRLLAEGRKSRLGEPYGQLYLALALLEMNKPNEGLRLVRSAKNRIIELKQNESNEPLFDRFPWHRDVVCRLLIDEFELKHANVSN